MKVECINSENKPAEFPTSRWIKKGNKYTITEVNRMNQQGDILGVKLAEIETDDLFPYTHFALSRFKPLEEDYSDIEELENVLKKDLELVN